MTRLLSRQLLLSSYLRLSLHIDLSVPDVQAFCQDMQVVKDFRPYCLVAQDDFLAKVNQSHPGPPCVAQVGHTRCSFEEKQFSFVHFRDFHQKW